MSRMLTDRSPARRVILRLDNGSLIGDRSVLLNETTFGATILPYEKGFAQGRVNEADVQRMQTLLARFNEYANGTELRNGLQPGNAHKRPAEQPAPAPLAKQARSEPAARPPVTGAESAPAQVPRTSWLAKCREVFEKVRKEMGVNYIHFFEPVDPKLVSDYYTIIKNPLFFKTIKQRLDTSQYQSPEEFCADMRLVSHNCFLYNRKGDFFSNIGQRASKRFESEWAKTNLPSAPPRGVDEPATASAGQAPRQAASRGYSKGTAKSKGSGGRAVNSSRAVNSAGPPQNKQPYSEERLAALGNLIGENADVVMQGLQELLEGTGALKPDEDGEMELDFECLDNAWRWKLDKYVRDTVAAAGRSTGKSVKVEVSSDDDDDSASDFNSD